MATETQRKWCGIGKHFVDRKYFNKDRRKHDGLEWSCRPCIREYKRLKYHADTEQGRKLRDDARSRSLKRKYGISREEYDALIEFQKSKCGVCREPLSSNTREIHLDHDHSTGCIRGILCRPCNIGMGFFKDNPEFLQNALYYLGVGEEFGNVPLSYACDEDV